MSGPDVTEEEIDAAEKLRVTDLRKSLDATQALIIRVNDPDLRMRLLFDVVTCASQLDLKEVTDDAVRELEKYPDPQHSRALANLSRADAEVKLGRPENALALVDMNLATGFFERDDFRISKFQLYLIKGHALAWLKRAEEALRWLDEAKALYPTKESAADEVERAILDWAEPDLQVARSNCLIGLGHFEEAYAAAALVLQCNDGDWASFALQQMAECRAWQGREVEALRIYADLKKRLPCRIVDEQRVDEGMANCVKRLEARQTAKKPS